MPNALAVQRMHSMHNSQSITKKDFSILRRAKSFVHAGRGIWLFVKTTPNAWIHLATFSTVVLAGIYVSLSSIEWAIIILTSAMVLAAEAFNTAIEIDINLTSPTYHPHARDTKDVAAAAVLITALAAMAVGVCIFSKYLL